MIIGTFRIGQTIEVAIDAESGDPTSASAVSAKMRMAKQVSSGLVLLADGPVYDLDVSDRAADDENPAGWNLTLSATQSADLAAGYYGIDAQWTVGGAVEFTETTAFIHVTVAALP